MKYTLIATATFGLESVVASELRNLGYENLKVENSKVEFEGDEKDIAKCNLWLRTADRVLIKMSEFKAESFEELFQGTKKVNWGDIIPINGKMHVNGKSVKSKLHSVPDCQSIVKKAVVESMKKKYNTDWFSEDGPVYKIEVAILKDIVTLTIDTSGKGLHKRGYRENAGEAPLKETLAAALVLLSKWNPSRPLIDPLCGSGTILIEAGLIGRNIAPGLNRDFVSETWPNIKKDIWDKAREEARLAINNEEFKILGSDINYRVLNTAKENIKLAGLEDYIFVQKLSVEEFSTKKKYGCIITNPPFGSTVRQSEQAYLKTYQLGKKEEDWLAVAARPQETRDGQSTEVLFIEQDYKFLKEGGYLAIVLPDGILTNSTMQYVRTQIEDWFRIIAVVSMPQTAFMANGAGVKSSVLFLKKWTKKETELLINTKKSIEERLLNDNCYLAKRQTWDKEIKQKQKEKANEIKNKQNISATVAKQTEEYKTWNTDLLTEYANKVDELKSILTDEYQQAKQKELTNYPIFMAIAENIGYDATGKRTPINELDIIGEELKKFIETI